MLQRKSFAVLIVCSVLCAIFAGCSESDAPKGLPATQATARGAGKAIVSLSPAATDLLLAMGAGEQLVGVSTYDNDPRVAALPRVGDYENVDWERIATLAPRYMIVQMAVDRLPAGFTERAKKLDIDILVIQIDRLDDVFRQIIQFGMICSSPPTIDVGREMKSTPGSEALQRTLEAQLASARRQDENQSRVRTVVLVSESNLGVAGRNTYLNDLLEVAGGENVLDASKGGYVQLDREALLALSPDAIIELNPSPTAAQRLAAKERLAALSELPAVKNGRVLVIEEPWALMPGAHVGELAERMARFLHPTP